MTQSCPAPSPPFWLLVMQTVSFSSLAWEFSAALLDPSSETVSRTVIDPDKVKVLFLVAVPNDACADSAHSQQLLWQI